ncbi:MAG: PEP/pyruvate-binding domain-containing protein [Pirellulaceae bacterium]|nr:hypothetical protein [Planctomycetales bacterium]
MTRTLIARAGLLLILGLCLVHLLVHPIHAQRGGGFGGRGGQDFGGPGRKLSPSELEFRDGVATIPDHATFQQLSYKGPDVMIDTFLAGLEFVKFTLDGARSENPDLYFINTVNHRGHPQFGRAVGLGRGGQDQMKGVLVYRPRLLSPSGNPGLYTFEFEPNDQYPFDMVKFARDQLVAKMPILKGNIAYYPRSRAMNSYQRDKLLYDNSDLPVYLDEDLLLSDVAYLPMNNAESFGRLRILNDDLHPSARDIVLCKSLPNELPRVAGMITAVRQTPLSHVNLRAVQDSVPNAFIKNAGQLPQISKLIDKYVYYKVTADGFELREAKTEEVEKHFENLRPLQPQVPARDLSNTKIRKLTQLGFDDAKSIGTKAANIATMHAFEFPAGTLPDGYAVPFYFYDEFMKHNGLYDVVKKLLNDQHFHNDREVQTAKLAELRQLITNAAVPDWMLQSFDEVQRAFPAGTNIRCRSSTNNEDLPGFSGAGLYDSFTHRPENGNLATTVKRVYASLWNDRAFEERQFYRIDHQATAMGVLLHPNYKGELANGVAVTDDILYDTHGNYYVNTQIGEDLVTNPEEESTPEEILLGWYKQDGIQVMQRSNRAEDGKLLLSDSQLDELRDRLARIHSRFRKLYGHSKSDRFAMEIEFKITADGNLAVKQARPWVFTGSASATADRR